MRYRWSMWRRASSLLLITILAASGPALAGAELRLIDGQVLVGEGVERRAEFYVLELSTGDQLTIPFELVAQVKLTGDDDPDATGLVEAEGQTLVGPPGGPTLPKRDEQLQAFGRPPAVFQPGVIDSTWEPKSDWDMDPATHNNWNPARWATSPIDWNWTPRSVFRKSSDVTEFSPVRWAKSPVSYLWYPTDGLKR